MPVFRITVVEHKQHTCLGQWVSRVVYQDEWYANDDQDCYDFKSGRRQWTHDEDFIIVEVEFEFMGWEHPEQDVK